MAKAIRARAAGLMSSLKHENKATRSWRLPPLHRKQHLHCWKFCSKFATKHIANFYSNGGSRSETINVVT